MRGESRTSSAPRLCKTRELKSASGSVPNVVKERANPPAPVAYASLEQAATISNSPVVLRVSFPCDYGPNTLTASSLAIASCCEDSRRMIAELLRQCSMTGTRTTFVSSVP